MTLLNHAQNVLDPQRNPLEQIAAVVEEGEGKTLYVQRQSE
jgi:hypothetical protein